MIVVGIDPATGKSSPMGIAVIDTDTKEILLLEELMPTKTSSNPARIRDLGRQLYTQLRTLILSKGKDIERVYIERFAMRGSTGELLHKLIGAMIYVSMTYTDNLGEVYNTTVKKIVGNDGRADKEEVALGVYGYFIDNPKSTQIIERLILKEKFDLTDALAIAIAGVLQDA